MSTQIGIPAMSNNQADWVKTIEPPKKEPVMATLVGDGGMGKTTLGALWPSPIFIPVENGTATLVGRDDVAVFPTQVSPSFPWVMDCLEKLAGGGHPFKTVVIDTITRLSDIIEREIVQETRAKSINLAHGGFGAGYKAMATQHEKVRSICECLKKQGMNVLFLAHATSEKISPPDQQEYTRYSIRIHKESLTHYSDNVDMVAYIKLQTFVTGGIDQTDKSPGKAGKATSSGKRVIVCYPTPSNISKNRYGITKDLDFIEGVNPFAAIL
jgi:hypothetical protein